MAKTYTITSTSINGGSTGSQGLHWRSYYGTSIGNVTGYSSSMWRAVNILFSSADLNQFAGKTITSVKLKITVTSGKLGSTSYPYRVRFKNNSTATGTASAMAWECTNDDTDLATLSSGTSSSTDVASNTVYTLSVGSTLPTYGYVIATTNQGVTTITLASTATLEVTTTETDKTYKLSYSNNGGSGSVASQSTTTTAASATFTVNPNSTSVSKTGYSFLGWSTNSSATTASYSNGSSITISANTTLYAVWQPYHVTIRYNANGGTMASAHGSDYALNGSGYVTKNGNTDFHVVNYGESEDPYNYNNTGAINIERAGYAAVSGAQWNTAANGSGTSFNQSTSYAATSYASNVTTGNRTITLYVNWNATTSYISASNGTLGTQMTIGIVRYNNAYTHTVTYKFGTQTGTVGTNIGTSVNWTPQLSWASEFTTSTSGTCELTCITYNGTTELGRTTTNITLSIPSTVKCTVSSVALAETVTSVANQFGAFVQNKSKIKVTGTTSTANAYGATVSGYTISINGQTLNSNGATTGLIGSYGTLSYTFKITDTRGRTDTYSGTYNVEQYTSPSVSCTAQRDSVDPTEIDVTYSWSISAVNNLNTKTATIKYRPFGGAWTTVTTYTLGTYAGTGTYAITGTDPDTGYDVQVQVTDFFTTVSNQSSVAALGDRIFGISHVDQTIARHGDSPADGKDHQYFAEEFHENVIFDKPVSFGTTSSFTGDATFSSGIITSYGDLATTGEKIEVTPSATSVSTSTWTDIASVSLSKGVWVLTNTARFASNSTGNRACRLSASSGGSSYSIQSNDVRTATNGDYTFCKSVDVVAVSSSSQTMYLQAWQNSGGTLSTTARIFAIKIS